jgi:hypothetical protein
LLEPGRTAKSIFWGRSLFNILSVENSVDFFRESGVEIQFSPLAKAHSFLVDKTTPYLSKIIPILHSSAGSMP